VKIFNVKVFASLLHCHEIEFGVEKRNFEKHVPLSKYFFNCLNDKNEENGTKNMVSDDEPLFIVILKSTFARNPIENLKKCWLFWFRPFHRRISNWDFVSFVTIRSEIVIITMNAIQSLKQISLVLIMSRRRFSLPFPLFVFHARRPSGAKSFRS
jgi:hypothetical protein